MNVFSNMTNEEIVKVFTLVICESIHIYDRDEVWDSEYTIEEIIRRELNLPKGKEYFEEYEEVYKSNIEGYNKLVEEDERKKEWEKKKLNYMALITGFVSANDVNIKEFDKFVKEDLPIIIKEKVDKLKETEKEINREVSSDIVCHKVVLDSGADNIVWGE